MLYYKAWLESRTRFLIGLGVIAALCLGLVLFHELFRSRMPTTGGMISYPDYIYLRVYGGFVRGIFLFVALVLGLGGLNSERARNTLTFTLALPVRRGYLLATRAITGLAEVALVALLPALLIPGLSAGIGQSYLWSQSFSFFVLWVAIGWAVFAAAFLASCLLENDYSALTTAIIAFYFYPLVVARTPFLRPYPLHIHYIMNGTGMPYFDARSHLFIGPMPWTILSCVTLVSFILLALAARFSVKLE
ncbi:MAG TPA: ABC transporter permease subunit [Bryobacteraceae bacterium]|nr:ABC transporter permease subunit [Bryobacteraceae bacterium]